MQTTSSTIAKATVDRAWSAFKEAQPAFDPTQIRVPTQFDYRRMLREQWQAMSNAVDELVSGRISAREFGERMQASLIDGHAQSWTLGRQRAGDLTAATADDFFVGLARADADADFLLSFLEDIEGDRYRDADGNLKPKAVKARAKLYAQKMRGTSGDAFVAACADEDEFTWVMAGIEHCSDCPELAALSPWTKDTLFAKPGDGETDCLGNCKCHLERSSDGRQSFKPVSL